MFFKMNNVSTQLWEWILHASIILTVIALNVKRGIICQIIFALKLTKNVFNSITKKVFAQNASIQIHKEHYVCELCSYVSAY